MDLNGNLGTEFFDDIDQTSPSVLANTNNAGTGVVAAVVSDVTTLTSSDYLLERSGATYTLTRLSDGTATTLSTFPGASEEVDGVTISLSSGAISSGDKFLIQPTRTAARDMGVAITNAALVAAAAPIRTAAASANTGSATVNAGAVDSPPPTDADLTQSVTITFTSATLFNVSGTGTGNPTGVAYTSGNDISYNGWTIKISGTPAAGDVFTVSANTNGYGDSRNANLLTDLQSEEILGSNTTSFTDAYGQVVADIGTKTHSTDINRTAQKSLLDHVIQTRESVSGVNLDEEAADILRFQQAYQAAAQVIAMSDTIFQTLLMAVRR
jgi:flagellar hook-associated protein 1 FlgK